MVTLPGSDIHWISEPFKSEDAARTELLMRELFRFFSDDYSFVTLIAKTQNNEFFLLTQDNPGLGDRNFIIQNKLTRHVFDLSSSSERKLQKAIACYYESIFNYPELKENMYKIMLRMILISRAPLLMLVKASMNYATQKKTLKQLTSSQEEIIVFFINNPSFKEFILSERAERESICFVEKIKIFQLHNKIPLMINFTVETIEAMHELQWQEIRSDSREEYSYTDELPRNAITIVDRAQTPEISDILNSRVTSPVTAATNRSPLLNSQAITPTSELQAPPQLTALSFIRNPRTFIKTLRGSPLAVIHEDHSNTNEPTRSAVTIVDRAQTPEISDILNSRVTSPVTVATNRSPLLNSQAITPTSELQAPPQLTAISFFRNPRAYIKTLRGSTQSVTPTECNEIQPHG